MPNPIATIFACSGALKKRGELDGLSDLTAFGEKLERACLDTLNDGIMTKDLAGLVEPGFSARAVDSQEFLDAIAQRLAAQLIKNVEGHDETCENSRGGHHGVRRHHGDNRAKGVWGNPPGPHQQRHAAVWPSD